MIRKANNRADRISAKKNEINYNEGLNIRLNIPSVLRLPLVWLSYQPPLLNVLVHLTQT